MKEQHSGRDWFNYANISAIMRIQNNENEYIEASRVDLAWLGGGNLLVGSFRMEM